MLPSALLQHTEARLKGKCWLSSPYSEPSYVLKNIRISLLANSVLIPSTRRLTIIRFIWEGVTSRGRTIRNSRSEFADRLFARQNRANSALSCHSASWDFGRPARPLLRSCLVKICSPGISDLPCSSKEIRMHHLFRQGRKELVASGQL